MDFVRSCSISNEETDQAVCAFLADDNLIQRVPQCTTSYKLEYEALAASSVCEHVMILAAMEPWQPGELQNCLMRQGRPKASDLVTAMEKSTTSGALAAAGKGARRTFLKNSGSVSLRFSHLDQQRKRCDKQGILDN